MTTKDWGIAVTAPRSKPADPSLVSSPEGSAGADQLPESDSLDEIERILKELVKQDRRSSERAAYEDDVKRTFLADFAHACDHEVRPAMEAVLDRLQRSGGGGVIETNSGGDPRIRSARIALWMSLEGEILDHPHPDRHPYLQFEADPGRRRVDVSEGDMSHSPATSGGRADVWTLAELTSERVTHELLTIVRRSAL
jgi:hypothetical protein